MAEPNPSQPPVDSPPIASPTPESPGVNAASAAEALNSKPESSMEPAPSDAKSAPSSEDLPPLTKEEMIKEALDCPCIASMKDGPCGTKFLFAYECFLRSDTEPKGSNCVDAFIMMHECMNEHPEVYDLDDDDEDPAKLRSAPKADTKDDANVPAPAPEPIKVSVDAPSPPVPIVPVPEPAAARTEAPQPQPVGEPEPVIKSGIQAPPIAAASIYEGYARRTLPSFALRQLTRFATRLFPGTS